MLGTTRLDSYYLDTGEQRWWMPIGSGSSLGTPLAVDDTLFVSTLGSTEPYIPTAEAVLAIYDKDHDGRLSHEEFKGDPDLGEHFGWIDADGDGFISAAEWNNARNSGIGEYGAIAIQPGSAKGKLDAESVRWRFKKNLPYIPAPLVYRGVYYMVRSGGIVTSLDPATGRLLKEGRSRDAMGDYYASPSLGFPENSRAVAHPQQATKTDGLPPRRYLRRSSSRTIHFRGRPLRSARSAGYGLFELDCWRISGRSEAIQRHPLISRARATISVEPFYAPLNAHRDAASVVASAKS